eukprot:5669928-Prymnesium_polylepis.1
MLAHVGGKETLEHTAPELYAELPDKGMGDSSQACQPCRTPASAMSTMPTFVGPTFVSPIFVTPTFVDPTFVGPTFVTPTF